MPRTVNFILILGYTFLFTPIIVLIINAFGDSNIPGVFTHFTLKWFKKAINNTSLIQATINSLHIAVFSATIAVVLGLIAALTTSKKQGKFLKNTMIIPIVTPEIIIGFSILMLFVSLEKLFDICIPYGLVTICIGHITATMAYAHINIQSKLKVLDKSYEEAALNLGAKPLRVFWNIKLPMLSSTILSSWILSFTISLDDLIIASFLTGPGASTLPVLIFSNIRTGITPEVNAFASLFILLVIVCVVSTYFLSNKKSKL